MCSKQMGFQYAIKHLRMKRNLNLKDFSLKIMFARICVHENCNTNKQQSCPYYLSLCNSPAEKSEGSKPKKPRKNKSNGKVDNHFTSLLKVNSDIIKKKVIRNNILLFRSQWIIQLILST